MTSDKNRLYAGAALALAVGAGFGIARLTQPVATAPADSEAAIKAASDVVTISPEAIAASRIGVAPAASGELDAAILASATVEATPDAEAVLTARAPGTVTRIFKRIGDPVGSGETIALVESRDASQIAAERASAAARVNLARQQAARERTLVEQGVSPRADLETAQANLAVAQADARRAAAAAGAVRLARDGRSVAVVSPVSGRITAAPANLGQFVAAETELFRVADAGRLQVTASVTPGDAGRIRSGDRVVLTTNDGVAINARVRSATGVVDPESRTATVVVTPLAGGASLVPGAPLLMQLPESEARWSIELITRLKQAGKPVDVYAFPDAGHVKALPRQKAAAYQRNLDWFRFWLLGDPVGDPSEPDRVARWQTLAAQISSGPSSTGATVPRRPAP